MYSNSSLNISTSTRQSPCVENGYIPSSKQFFQDLSLAERVIIIIMCCVLTPITVAIYTIHVHFLLQSKTHCMDRRSSVWILSLLPVTSLSSALTLCLPRLAAMSDLLSSMTLALGVLHFKLEVLDHFGDVNTVVQALKSVRIPVSTPPLCLFRWCCQTFQLTRFRFRLITCCVLQAAILQLMAAMLSLAFFMENNSNFRQNPDFHLSVAKCVSTLLAIYGLCLAVAATEPVWKPLDVTPKCAILLTWLCLFNGQGLIFVLLDMNGIPACTGHLTSRVRGKAIMDMLLLTEMLVMAAVARYSYHKLDLRSTDAGLFTDSKEMSGLEDRSCTESPDTGTDPWASTGLTDSSLFLTDSSETSDRASRRVVPNYGTITSSSVAQIQTDTVVPSCGDVKTVCENVNSLCGDVNSSCEDVNSLCGDVNSLCEDVNLSVQQITDKQE